MYVTTYSYVGVMLVIIFSQNILYCRLLRQILNEVLRLTTLATFAARYSNDDVVAGGYLIPAGTPIMMALGVSLKNKTVWKDSEKSDA